MVLVGDHLGVGPGIPAPFFLPAGDLNAKHTAASGTEAPKTHW